MRAMVQIKGKKKKRRVSSSGNNRPGGTQEQRIKKSKMNDPLLNPPANTDQHEEQEGEEEGEEVNEQPPRRVYTEREMRAGQSTSGRNLWKQKHAKGKFNVKMAKKKNNNDRLPGSFVKPKTYKN